MKWPISHLRSSGILWASVLTFASLFSSQLALGQSPRIIPPDRNFTWNPGMMSKGGIPNRTTICATISPRSGDQSAAIQAALDSCPSNQVVMLNPGTFIVNNYVLIHSGITLRGSGAGVTILNKANGAHARLSTVVPGTNGIHTPQSPSLYTYDTQPIVIVGPSRYPGPDNSTSQSLTADGQQGAYSVTIAGASGFAAGQFVLLDETSGASWQPVPLGFGCTNNVPSTPCPPVVWQGDRVAWNMHYPKQQWQDDSGNSNTSGPYDTTPGVLPAAMSWFSRKDRPTVEIKEVASVSGNTITFTSPLTIGYRVSHSAQLTRYTLTGSQSTANSVHVTNAGVENLSMYGGADGELRFEAAAYSWAKSVEVTQWIGEGVAIDNSFRIEVRDSYIHTGSWPSPGGAGYVISLANGSSEVLIENNIMIDTCKDIVMRSSGSGTVVAYNYADDPWDNNATTWQEVALNASHMAGPHHVLFEGNYAENFDSDYTHGNAIYLTVFRNVLTGQRRDFTDAQNLRAGGLAYGSWWDSFIGNILGRSGQMSGWSYTNHAMSCDASGNNCTGNNGTWSDKNIWKLGYDPERWTMYPDPKVLSTVIRDGNYDFVTNSQRWHNTPGGFAIPNSMYLTSKPSFFGNNPWPWVDPTTGAIYTLPAKARYDAGISNQVNYTIAVSTPPSGGGKVSGGGTFASGSSRTVTATANSGYTFANWTENGGVVSAAASYTFTLTANRTLVAIFTANQVNYAIAVSAFSPSPSAGGTAGGTVSGGGTFPSGSSRTVTATANSGYTFAAWIENGSVVSAAASYTFTLTANRILVAIFTANQVDYTIAVSASPSASATVSGGGTFPSGSSRTVTATANSGYTFANWSENGVVVSSSASYTFTLSANRTLSATMQVSGGGSPVTIGDTTVLLNPDSQNANLLITQNATLLQQATFQSLSFYVTVAGGNLRLGIYDATGPNGGPGTLKAQTNSFATVLGWNTQPVVTPVSLPAGTYWLAYLPDNNSLSFVKNTTTGTSGRFYTFTYGPMPAIFSTTPQITGSHWSFYGTLSVP
jgi:hypothetical protein